MISAFLGKDVILVKTELKNFFAFFSPENISTVTGVCSNAVTPYLERILQKKLNYDQIFDVLDQSRELVEDFFLQFLDETVGKMKIDFENLELANGSR